LSTCSNAISQRRGSILMEILFEKKNSIASF